MKVCRALSPLLLMLALACDSGGPTAEQKAAQAKREAEEAEQKARLEKIKAEREAKEQAEAEAEAEKKAAIDALAVLPETMPKPKKACEQVGEAMDGYMTKAFADKPETLEKWKASKTMQVATIVKSCKGEAKVEVAACQIHALNHAPIEMVKSFNDFMRRCKEKFGADAPAE